MSSNSFHVSNRYVNVRNIISKALSAIERMLPIDGEPAPRLDQLDRRSSRPHPVAAFGDRLAIDPALLWTRFVPRLALLAKKLRTTLRFALVVRFGVLSLHRFSPLESHE